MSFVMKQTKCQCAVCMYLVNTIIRVYTFEIRTVWNQFRTDTYLFELVWLFGNEPEPRLVNDVFEFGRATPKLEIFTEF